MSSFPRARRFSSLTRPNPGIGVSGPATSGFLRRDTLLSSGCSISSPAEIPALLSELSHLDLSGMVKCRKPSGESENESSFRARLLEPHGLREADVAMRKYYKNIPSIQSIDNADQILLRDALRELRTWSMLRHDNVVELVGYVLDSAHYISPITNWSENGRIMEYIRDSPKNDLFELCFGMAEGLAYLHSRGVVHGDLRADNILISNAGAPLLSNFGISRVASNDDAGEMSRIFRWKTSELLFTPRAISMESDTWAYGMTVLELITREAPYIDQSDVQAFMSILSKRLPERESELPEDSNSLRHTCHACWHPDATSRPSMSVISDALRAKDLKILKSIGTSAQLKRTLIAFSEGDLTGKVVQLEEFFRDRGGHSDVYYGKMVRSRLEAFVAIKRVHHRLHDDLTSVKRLVRELQIWSRLKHENILPLLGFTVDGGLYYLSLITEWMEQGTVLQFVKNNPGQVDLPFIIHGISRGLEYLHSLQIVHSDVKSGNVLVSPEGLPLVTDFGISHMVSSNSVAPLTGGMYSTLRWMAHEQLCILEEETIIPYTRQSDVWAFGMTILELLTLEVPYAHITYDIQVTLAIAHGKLPKMPSTYDTWNRTYKTLWSICKECWNLNPNSRPSMEQLKARLHSIRACDELGDVQ